jgi:hypothetical protein
MFACAVRALSAGFVLVGRRLMKKVTPSFIFFFFLFQRDFFYRP